jgi:ketosteroid isomerase-like protein
VSRPGELQESPCCGGGRRANSVFSKQELLRFAIRAVRDGLGAPSVRAARSSSRDTERAMSQENVEIAQQLLKACASGDLDAALAHADPKMVWNPTQEGQAEGITAVRATMERWEESFQDLVVSYEETIDAGDRVVLKTHVSGRGRGSGVEVDDRSYMVWTLRRGKVLRMDEFTERADALEAAGLSE